MSTDILKLLEKWIKDTDLIHQPLRDDLSDFARHLSQNYELVEKGKFRNGCEGECGNCPKPTDQAECRHLPCRQLGCIADEDEHVRPQPTPPIELPEEIECKICDEGKGASHYCLRNETGEKVNQLIRYLKSLKSKQ